MLNRTLLAVLCGILFGAGLAISDMINPARVLAFLDVAGAWDPTLAFVMGGALIPSAAAYLIKNRMPAPVLEQRFHVPTNRTIDTPLVGGAVIFGLGWGLVGLCPGPAVAALVTLKWQAIVFVIAMIAGMAAYRYLPEHQAKAAA
jgi:uncharacterized membrane protein YedE/YeeE